MPSRTFQSHSPSLAPRIARAYALFALAQCVLGAFARGDVADESLVIQKIPGGVAHDSRGDGDPDDAAIFFENAGFKAGDAIINVNLLDESGWRVVIDIQLPANILDGGLEFLRRIISVHSGQ